MILTIVSLIFTSLLLNGDFEGELRGWSISFYPKGEGIERCIAISDARSKSGRYSLRIDTSPVLGEETTLVFNGAVSEEATRLAGKRVLLSGWVYIEPRTAVRPISMRLRSFGKDERGRTVFLGDVLSLKVVGKPGEWVRFHSSGVVPDLDIKSMDLHCAIRPDLVRTLQFLDDLRLELYTPPPIEMVLLKDAIWSDETVLPVEVRLNEPKAGEIRFTLTKDGEVIRRWSRKAETTIFGLTLPETGIKEGEYLLRSDLLDEGGRVLAEDERRLVVVESPWRGVFETAGEVGTARFGTGVPEGFKAMGSVAPADLPELIPDEPEILSPDLDLSDQLKRGYLLFSRHYLEPVSALGRPRPGEIGPIRIFACPGEYEPATISVWAAEKALKGVQVETGDLSGEKGSIGSENLDVRVVRRIKGLPPFLEKRRSTDIPKGQTRTFWLTLHIPPETPPGFYRGRITISPRNSEPREVDLLVRVLSLRLPPPPRGYGFWWKMDARWNGYHSKEREEALEQIRKQFLLLREHGCNMVSCYGMPRMERTDGGEITFDFNRDHWGHNRYSLADFFRLGRETGLFSPRVPIQYVGAESLHTHWIARALKIDLDSPAFDEFYKEACRRVDRWVKERGFTLAFACVDEIGNSPERRRTALRFYRLAHEAGVLTSVTDNSMHGGMHLMGQKRFDEIIDMRLYNFITPEMIEQTRRSGDRLWLYNLGSGGWDAKRDRFVFGLFVERCGAEGYSQWAFQWPSRNTDPYEAAAKGERTGYHYALPAPDGPLPTTALEGVREGIDDARYLSVLSSESRGDFLREIEPLSIRIGDYLSRHSGIYFDVCRWLIARKALSEQRSQ